MQFRSPPPYQTASTFCDHRAPSESDCALLLAVLLVYSAGRFNVIAVSEFEPRVRGTSTCNADRLASAKGAAYYNLHAVSCDSSIYARLVGFGKDSREL